MTDAASPKENEAVRLNRYIAMCGVCSRREADALIAAGRVTVDEAPGQPGQRIREGQRVRVDGKVVQPAAKRVVIALNKPRGVVCSTDRRWGDTLVEDIVKSEERLFPMGRLDKDSEGLLLLTNDGALSEAVMRGRNLHEKEYEVTVDKPLTRVFLDRLEEGVWLEELQVRTRPCRIRTVDAHTFRIILTQGLNRQIRRMCLALGYRVRTLKRIRIMGVTLGSLQTGAYRPLSSEEIGKLTDP